MKKFLSLVLALTIALSTTYCAFAEEDDEILVVLPLMEQLVNGTLKQANAETYYYDNATIDDLYTFLVMSSLFGIYYYDATASLESDDMLGFMLFVPGTEFSCIVLFSPSDGQLLISTEDFFYIPTEEMYYNRMSYLAMDLKLPTGAGENVMPQFYHCVGRNPYASNLTGEIDSVFDGQMCWTEYYDEIDQDRLMTYTLFMTMFGFDVWVDAIVPPSDLVPETYFLHYSNGDAEVIVWYTSDDQTATVYYEPGVSYYLLSGTELMQAIPE